MLEVWYYNRDYVASKPASLSLTDDMRFEELVAGGSCVFLDKVGVRSIVDMHDDDAGGSH